jgi:hypothetical protein
MNPELQRNLWLEASRRRLAWAAVVLALIYGATWVLASHTQTTAFINGRYVTAGFPAFETVGALVFLGAGLIWGARATSRALIDEVLGRTWTFQRTSTLGPWEMTWGKLFGATSLAWIAALTGLLALALPLMSIERGRFSVALFLWGVSLAVLAQASALGSTLIGVRKARAEVRLYSGRVGFGGILGLVLLLWALSHVFPLVDHQPAKGMESVSSLAALITQPIRWWDHEVPRLWFMTASMAAFAGWAVVGAWRLMRLELQLRNWPWAWAGFVLFAGLYAAGFAPEGGRFAVAAAVFAACAYAAAFAEPADRVRLKLWAGAVRHLRLRQIYLGLPAVIPPLKLSFLAVIGALLSARSQPGDTNHPGLFLFASYVFVLRDLCVIAYFRFAPRAGGRGDFGAVVALALIYFIGVTAAGWIGGGAGQALFLPAAGHEPLSLFSAVVEAALMAVLAAGRVRTVQVRA